MGQMKKVVAKQLLAEESDFVPYPREVREGQRAQMKRGEGGKRQLQVAAKKQLFPTPGQTAGADPWANSRP